jgi:hypothetical protein
VLLDLPGNYAVTGTAPNGCSASQSTVMYEDANLPQGSAEGAVLNCLNNGQSSISGTVMTAGATGSWTFPDGSTTTDLQPTVTQGGTYVFAVSATNGCIREYEVEVEVDFNAPTALAAVNEMIDCNTPTVTLQGAGSSSGGQFSYVWTTTNGHLAGGAIGLTPTVDAPGTYTLEVTNLINGCTDVASVEVLLDPQVPTAFDLTVHDIPCFGLSGGAIELHAVIGGTQPFAIELADDAGLVLSHFNQLPAGSYLLTLEDANGCFLDTTVTITEPAQLWVDLGDDYTVQLGESVTFFAELAYSTPLETITWDPVDQCDSAQALCTTFTDTPFQSYRQTIRVVDVNGCAASDEVLVLVKKERLVYVATSFTPEADNPENALLNISTGAGITRIKRWLIFDRWGEAVHEVVDLPVNTLDAAWDGRVRGKYGDSAVYVWYAELEFVDGSVEVFKGDVTLVRL